MRIGCPDCGASHVGATVADRVAWDRTHMHVCRVVRSEWCPNCGARFEGNAGELVDALDAHACRRPPLRTRDAITSKGGAA
jgi:hypothetical protein